MRLWRICSRQRDFEKRAADLTAFLVNLKYKKGFARGQVDRAEPLTDKHRERNDRAPFVVTYYPGLPNIGPILRLCSHRGGHRAVTNVPMIAFRRPKSLPDYLVRVRIKEKPGAEGEERGTNKIMWNEEMRSL